MVLKLRLHITDNKRTFHAFSHQKQNFRITDVMVIFFQANNEILLIISINDKNIDFSVRVRIYECTVAFKLESVSL
ncbi:hypothetical protein BWD162_001870 [Bartonella sp. WD16.2]|nr:hypothetical protein BWD162_001870 [Bartonella sp. WD16.2]